MPSPKSAGCPKPRRDAGPLALPHVRRQGLKRHFDLKSGAPMNHGLVEVRDRVQHSHFVCPNDGHLRDARRGCGPGCACVTCEAAPRRDGKPPTATIKTCKCNRCRRRRGEA